MRVAVRSAVGMANWREFAAVGKPDAGRLNLIVMGGKLLHPGPSCPTIGGTSPPQEVVMSNVLQQLGIDRWPVADRLALLQELRDSLPTGPPLGSNPGFTAPRPRADRRDGAEPARPWRDALTDLGGEG